MLSSSYTGSESRRSTATAAPTVATAPTATHGPMHYERHSTVTPSPHLARPVGFPGAVILPTSDSRGYMPIGLLNPMPVPRGMIAPGPMTHTIVSPLPPIGTLALYTDSGTTVAPMPSMPMTPPLPPNPMPLARQYANFWSKQLEPEGLYHVAYINKRVDGRSQFIFSELSGKKRSFSYHKPISKKSLLEKYLLSNAASFDFKRMVFQLDDQLYQMNNAFNFGIDSATDGIHKLKFRESCSITFTKEDKSVKLKLTDDLLLHNEASDPDPVTFALTVFEQQAIASIKEAGIELDIKAP